MPQASMPGQMMITSNGMVFSQPQLMAPRPQILGLPGQQAMVPGQIMLGGPAGVQHGGGPFGLPHQLGQVGGGQLGQLVQQGGHLGLLGGLGMPRFR